MKEKNKVLSFGVLLFIYYVLGTSYVLYQQFHGKVFADLGAFVYYSISLLPITIILTFLFRFNFKKSLKLIIIGVLCLFIGTLSTVQGVNTYREYQQIKHIK